MTIFLLRSVADPETDLAGEKVEIPSGLVAGPPPPTSDFFFSELPSDAPYDTQV